MLVGNNLYSNLSAAITATQTNITMASYGSLAVPAGSHAYALLDDGTMQEIVKITAVSASGGLTVERGQLGTTAKAFVSGVCVKPYWGYEAICELIAQGGCGGGGVVACTPVAKGAAVFQDAVIGSEWNAVASFSNATSVSVPIKPAWVTATISGGSAILTGVPPVGAIDFAVIVIANGCNNSSVTVDRVVKVCAQVGVA